MKLVLAVAAGGAVGAVARYLVMSQAGHWLGHGYPYGTLIVNAVGSLVLGFLIEAMALVWSPGEAVRAMIVIGLLGSFTTFSTFSMEVVLLAQRGSVLVAAGYVAAGLATAIGGLAAGIALGRSVLP